MSDWAVGLSTGCFCGSPILECLEDIRNAGFGRIEVCSRRGHLDYHDLDHVRRAAEKINRLGLESYSFHAPFANEIDITSPDAAVRETALAELMKAAEAAALLRVRHFVLHPGPETSAPGDEERFGRMQNAVGVLNRAYARCRELGIGLVLENMLPHLFAGKVRDLLWMLGALDTTEAGICLDTGHAHLGEEVAKVVHKLSGHLWMMHASDNHGHHDDHLPPGDGRIDWAKLLAHLNRIHFNGTIILEIRDLGGRQVTLEGARRGRKHLRELSHRLRISI
jgi:sugar phosphate isomerase/epimerase